MFSIIKNVLKILAWFTDRWKSIKKRFKQWRLKRYEKKIDKALDNDDIDTINRIMRDIKEKREGRRNSSS